MMLLKKIFINSQLIAATAIAHLLFFAFAGVTLAKTEVFFGEFSYTYGDNESLTQAKEICKRSALKNALESAMVYVSSEVRVNSGRLEKLDLYSLSEGCITNVTVLNERVEGRNIYCRIQGAVDLSLLDKRTQELLQKRISPGKKVSIAFHGGTIQEGPYGKDDSNPAPDSYVLIKDNLGNTVFSTSHYFLDQRKIRRLLRNRNNYKPDLEGASFTYTFTSDSYLLVYLMDWDGCEGVLCSRRSPDDIIGKPYRMDINHPFGKHWVGAEEWRLEIDIAEFR
jgi:hypothetical protein